MLISKKLRNFSAAIHSVETAEKTQDSRKKCTFYKEQVPKQVETYLEKIKDIHKERLVYIEKLASQTAKLP